MIRATTPTHFFTLPVEYKGNIENLVVTYSQKSKPVLEKDIKDVTFDENGVGFHYKLTQEETSLFEGNIFAEVQVRVKLKDGSVTASDIYTLPVNRVLNDEVL